MTDSEKRTAPKKSNLPLLLAILLLLVLLGGAWYYFGPGRQRQAIPTGMTPATEQPAGQPGAAGEKGAESPLAKPDASAGKKPKTQPSECDTVAGEIKQFFIQLDSKDYIAGRNLPGGSHAYFSHLVDKIIANPPVVSGEKESPFTILTNTAHFYRTLGAEDTLLIKEVLENESDSLEKLLAIFYRWSVIAPDCPQGEVLIQMPLSGLYEYAGFFLNTLGGQSYLFRRESRLRMLTRFYAVKILDRAETAELNRYGIDMRPTIDSLLEEMGAAANLTEKEAYLAELMLLQDKYAKKFGGRKAK